jgi:hypothetical protein
VTKNTLSQFIAQARGNEQPPFGIQRMLIFASHSPLPPLTTMNRKLPFLSEIMGYINTIHHFVPHFDIIIFGLFGKSKRFFLKNSDFSMTFWYRKLPAKPTGTKLSAHRNRWALNEL